MTRRVNGESEPVLTDAHAGMEGYAVSDMAMRKGTISADKTIISQNDI